MSTQVSTSEKSPWGSSKSPRGTEDLLPGTTISTMMNVHCSYLPPLLISSSPSYIYDTPRLLTRTCLAGRPARLRLTTSCLTTAFRPTSDRHSFSESQSKVIPQICTWHSYPPCLQNFVHHRDILIHLDRYNRRGGPYYNS